MSPVSRGRKGKMSKRKGPTPPKAIHLFSPLSTPPPRLVTGSRPAFRGEWFDEATESVLDGADVLLTARGPRELEEATCKLTGAALYKAIQDETTGLDIEAWFSELLGAAAIEADQSEGKLRLLYGLTAITPIDLPNNAQRKISQRPANSPAWLRSTLAIEASGDVWRMHDVYRSRIALIADFHYADDTDPSVFLFDIDASGEIRFMEPGVFDDLAQAAEAWRAQVGDTAPDAPPIPVDSPDDLRPLMYVEAGEMGAFGDESRAHADNWFRVLRRIQEVFEARTHRGMPEPSSASLYHDIDFEPMAKAFTQWHTERHGTELDHDAVAALTEEWLKGTLPDVVHSVSPRRLAHYQALINDFQGGYAARVQPLFPEWVRWHGEQAGLPRHLIDQAVAQAPF